MNDSFKNMFSLDGNKVFKGGNLEKIYSKWFARARKSISTTWNKAVVTKYVSIRLINYFVWQRNR